MARGVWVRSPDSGGQPIPKPVRKVLAGHEHGRNPFRALRSLQALQPPPGFALRPGERLGFYVCKDTHTPCMANTPVAMQRPEMPGNRKSPQPIPIKG